MTMDPSRNPWAPWIISSTIIVSSSARIFSKVASEDSSDLFLKQNWAGIHPIIHEVQGYAKPNSIDIFFHRGPFHHIHTSILRQNAGMAIENTEPGNCQ